jgi:ABC-2 type transport system ATP-binding protein
MTVNNAALKRRLGVLPETLGLFDPLYGHEFLAFVARMYSVSEDETRHRVAELLAALDLTDVRKMIGEYSTGMRKRLAFAAAVIHSPEVLFLDEPFESVDPAGVAAMKKWLRRFTEQGRTVFITSHVLDTVERFCDRVAVVTKPGRLVWEGDLAVLQEGGELRHGSKAFRSLESLFLDLTGENHADMAWL